MKVNSVSSNSFKGIDVSGVTRYYRPLVRKDLKNLKKLAKDCDIEISSKCVKDPRNYNKYINALAIKSKPLKDNAASKDAIEAKSLYIPGLSLMNFINSVKANVAMLKNDIKNVK